jgi:hypothetical protein
MTNLERLKYALKMITQPDDTELTMILLENGLSASAEYTEENKINIYKTAIEILEDHKTYYIEKGYKTDIISSASPKDYIAVIDSTIESYQNKIRRFQDEKTEKKRNTLVQLIY